MNAIDKEDKLRNETDTIKAKELKDIKELKMIYAKHSEYCSKFTFRDHLICAISEYGSPFSGDSG